MKSYKPWIPLKKGMISLLKINFVFPRLNFFPIKLKLIKRALCYNLKEDGIKFSSASGGQLNDAFCANAYTGKSRVSKLF